MEIYWSAQDWIWGLLLIVLTIAIHAMGVVMMALVGVRIRVGLETRSLGLRLAVPIVIGVADPARMRALENFLLARAILPKP